MQGGTDTFLTGRNRNSCYLLVLIAVNDICFEAILNRGFFHKGYSSVIYCTKLNVKFSCLKTLRKYAYRTCNNNTLNVVLFLQSN